MLNLSFEPPLPPLQSILLFLLINPYPGASGALPDNFTLLSFKVPKSFCCSVVASIYLAKAISNRRSQSQI